MLVSRWWGCGYSNQLPLMKFLPGMQCTRLTLVWIKLMGLNTVSLSFSVSLSLSPCLSLLSPFFLSFYVQMEFDEKELRKEISYAIKNIHGIRHVCSHLPPSSLSLSLSLSIYPSLSLSLSLYLSIYLSLSLSLSLTTSHSYLLSAHLMGSSQSHI